MADFRRRGGRSFPPRQTNLDWARSETQALVTVAAGAKSILAGFNASADRTVRRVIGTYWVQGDDVSNQEFQVGVIGGMVVSDLAFAAGAASVPGPFTERSDDYWALWVPFMQTNEKIANGGVGRNSGGMQHFDSKAQRKLPHGSTYAIIVENSSASAGLEIAVAVSLLVSH